MRAQFLFAVVLLFLAACEPEEPVLPPLAQNAVVLAFGDSLTAGKGVKPDKSYPALLAELIGRRVVRSGVSGERAARGLKRLPGVLDQYRPDLLILCHGGNDLLKSPLGSDKAAESVRAMVQLAKQRGIEVVLVGVPSPGPFVSEAADFYAEIAEEFKIPLEPTVIAEILGNRSLKSDMVHPNGKGYAKIADAVFALLKKSKAI